MATPNNGAQAGISVVHFPVTLFGRKLFLGRPSLRAPWQRHPERSPAALRLIWIRMGEVKWSDDPLQVYLSAVGEIPPLEKSEESVCIDHVQAGDEMAETARKRLVEANLHLVIALAENYRDGGIHILDLIEKGNSGLLLAAQNLAGQYVSSFSVYATPFIERALADVRVPEPITPAHKRNPSR